MYKTLGFMWLHEAFCPASAFVSVDRNEARNPQRFIYVGVVANYTDCAIFCIRTDKTQTFLSILAKKT